MKILKTFFLALLLVAVILAACGWLLVRRGFRATTAPSALETLVARTLRGLSVPAVERSAKNPFAASSDSLQQGRELFVSQCAACHGIDGSGRTQPGLNLYPRVPDLRATSTQNLSDGEIHYIIENGVQLTGMPAWGNPHLESPGNSWKLVLFIRSLRPLSTEEQSQQAAAAGSARYAGSQACEKCHAEIYARWQKTPMANVVRDPRTHPDAIIPDLETNRIAKFRVDQVAFVYGSLWKQRYFTKVGDDYFPLPVQWVVGEHNWRPYMVPATGGDWWGALYPPDNMQRPTGPTCDGCHSVDYNIQTKQVAEWNVGCERCHGPGSEHVAHPSRGNVLNPAQMDAVAGNDTCIQCHSQGQPLQKQIEGKYYDWPVGYRVGLRLQDFWKLEDCTLGQTTFYYFPDCTAHKNRMQGNDFAQSVMYGHGIRCSSCHDAHGTANYAQLRKPADQICLDCHGPTSANGPHTATLAEHTHHKDGSAGSACVACHMPAIETEGVPGAFVHAHTFRFIPPSATEKYGIPNPCTSCHADKSTGWAQDAMSRWPERSAWRR
ncbi:MAG TPA: cytochrome c3 family protein [Candidatus Sulfotelmatobacter sp.]|nr:cytochrome c3 family protein [Candidatus Sulfotelmatobacter sp.]